MTSVAATTGTQVPITTLQDEVAATKAAQNAPKGSSTLDSNAFLQLLVAQLKYQDPDKPADSSQFMAQQAQLSSLEKITALADTSRSSFTAQQKLSAASLVGRDISWRATDGTTSTGRVSAANIAGDNPTLSVNGHEVSLDDVLSVSTTALSVTATAA